MKKWIKAMRLRTLPLSFSTIMTGSAVAFYSPSWSWTIFVMTLVTTLFLQVLSNFANDYGDYIKGTDNEKRIGPARALQSGDIKIRSMKIAVIVTGLLSFISGSFLIFLALRNASSEEIFLFFVLGCLAIAAALFYTVGKKAYGYSGWGDVFVFIFFGLIGVGGSYYLQSHYFYSKLLFPSAGIGFLSAGVLNMNNMRDHVNDAASGKNTVVVKMGFKNSKIYHFILICSGLFCLFFFLLRHMTEADDLLPLLSLPLFILHLNAVRVTDDPAQLDPQLKKLALSTFIFSILFFTGQIISF